MGSPVQGGSAAGTTYPVPPVVLGGIDAGGVVRTLLTDTTGRISVTASSPLAVALGVQFEPYPVALAASTAASPTQQIWGSALYATAGASITGVKIRNAVAAAGTLPTTARFGLADSTGKMLALSSNVNALANWGLGVCSFPITTDGGTTKYVTTYSGVYYACMVVNGVWGTTQPTPVLPSASISNLPFSADGSFPAPSFTLTGQTDLPAVGSSVAITTPAGRIYYMPLY